MCKNAWNSAEIRIRDFLVGKKQGSLMVENLKGICNILLNL